MIDVSKYNKADSERHLQFTFLIKVICSFLHEYIKETNYSDVA